MAQLVISGSMPKRGSIQISGAKNAALPLMAACLLTKNEVMLRNIPNIKDVESMRSQLESFGVNVSDGLALVLNAANASFSPKTNDYNPIRGGLATLGPLLARFGEAKVRLPGGCDIGKSGRPVDYHIDALKKMGAEEVPNNENCICLKAKNGLKGKNIHFPNVSVGATENIMMAACLADGETIITNAAVEPEVIDLVNMLKKMGANIKIKHRKNKITVQGRGKIAIEEKRLLSGTTHTVIPDRIEAGSYAIAAAISGGPLLLKMNPSAENMLSIVVKKLKKAGVQATWQDDGLLVQRSGEIRQVDITTGPHPKFPTDLLPQWVTFMTLAKGTSRIEDTVYDKRFQHVEYLVEMGAYIIKKSDRVYIVNGGAELQGTDVIAEDLRGGFALILAGMAAEGSTVVKEIHHVERGYGNIKENLAQCGAIFEQLRETSKGHHGHTPQ